MHVETKFKDLLLGVAMGDALGVPFENLKKGQYTHVDGEQVDRMYNSFTKRHAKYPPHGQPKGAWSDDTSLTLILIKFLETYNHETMSGDFDTLMQDRADWLSKGSFTPNGMTFGTGSTTRDSVQNYVDGVPALECGLTDDANNGNGTLMSLAPLAYYAYKNNLSDDNIIDMVFQFLKTSHNTELNFIYCTFHTIVMTSLLWGESPLEYILDKTYHLVSSLTPIDLEPLLKIRRNAMSIDDAPTSGFVVHTTEAAYACIQNSNSYRECMINAVNMGGDVDTIAAVAAPIATILWGLDDTDGWLTNLQNVEALEKAAQTFEDSFQ